MFKRYIFLFALISLLFTSCRDDFYYGGISPEDIDEVLEDGYAFDLMVEDPLAHTRDVNFQPGASLRVNMVWMGVFDMESGDCISRNYRLLNYASVISGETQKGIVRMALKDPVDPNGTNKNYEGKDLIVVCIANFKDVEFNYMDHSISGNDIPAGADEEENPDEIDDPNSLKYMLNNVKSWREFNEIAVHAATAFSGDHNGDTPVLAGFLYNDRKDDTSHIKIDQFAEAKNPNSGKVFLSPNVDEVVSTLVVKFGDISGSGKPVYYTTDQSNNNILVNQGMTLHMRRLVANINVNIQVDPSSNLELTEVTYKRFNMPNYVYIIERRTTDCEIISETDSQGRNIFKANPSGDIRFSYNETTSSYDASLSPNYSDKYHNDPVRGFHSDTEWQGTQNVNSFSFQHFANKHWSDLDKNAYGQLVDARGVVEREELNDNGAFTALVGRDGSPDDFRNYATYFVIKMHLVDTNTGKAYEAEYTIHEGNTSDELGTEIPYTNTPIGNQKDYVVARNINYYYNVVIKGADNIYHNVTQSRPHSSGQGGKVWQFRYVNNVYDNSGKLSDDKDYCYYDATMDSFYNPVSEDGGLFQNAITITNSIPNLAFRLYGYNPERTDSQNESDAGIEGFNYNFSDDSFRLLKGMWPEPSGDYSHYYQNIDQLMNPENHKDDGNKVVGIPQGMLAGLRFIKADPNTDNLLEDENYLERFLEREYDPTSDGKKTGLRVFDIKQFMNYYYQEQSVQDRFLEDNEIVNEKWHLWISKSDINEQLNRNVGYKERTGFVRAIYIADRNGKIDDDGCTTLVNIFAAAQYPKFDALRETEKEPIYLLSSYANIDLVNIKVLHQNLASFSIPVLNNYHPSHYEYVLTIGNKEFRLSDRDYVERTPSVYNYKNIPVNLVTAGDIKLKAISTGKNEFLKDSGERRIGSMTLNNPPKWINGDGGDFDAAIKYYGQSSNKFIEFSGTFLHFVTNGTDRGFNVNTTNNIVSLESGGGAANIEFDAYQDCTITINAWHNGTRQVGLFLDGVDTGKDTGNIPTSVNGSWSKTIDVTNISPQGTKVSLRPKGGGLKYVSIEVKPK